MTGVPEITVQNAQRKVRLALAPLRQFAVDALQRCLALAEPAPSDLRTLEQVTLVLVSDRRMSALHAQFLQITGPTDVITFQHGDIFVSVETAAANARGFRTTTDHEVRLYLVHGLLHLHGFDDTTPAQARLMERTQQHLLRALTGVE
ncbi:MAG: rRNA maturation RNase YbeY [Chthoniobacterales bacterium]|nr:rRNA maturation RNase YbeY [Chthoniobacterales bacterium]